MAYCWVNASKNNSFKIISITKSLLYNSMLLKTFTIPIIQPTNNNITNVHNNRYNHFIHSFILRFHISVPCPYKFRESLGRLCSQYLNLYSNISIAHFSNQTFPIQFHQLCVRQRDREFSTPFFYAHTKPTHTSERKFRKRIYFEIYERSFRR